ncbi:hypothetical protein FRB90_007885, partial [Tulasnella sp. 427]
MISRTGSSDTSIHYPEDFGMNDLATLEVMSVTTPSEPNTLEAAIFRYMLKTPIPLYFVRRAPVLGIKVNRHDGPAAERTPLSYPARLYLDPYLYENRDLVDQKLKEMEKCFEEADKWQKTAQHFTPKEGQDPMADIKRTIHYLENVAQPGGDKQREARLKSMAEKLKATMESLGGQLSQCRERSHELLEKAAGMLKVPELTRVAFMTDTLDENIRMLTCATRSLINGSSLAMHQWKSSLIRNITSGLDKHRCPPTSSTQFDFVPSTVPKDQPIASKTARFTPLGNTKTSLQASQKLVDKEWLTKSLPIYSYRDVAYAVEGVDQVTRTPRRVYITTEKEANHWVLKLKGVIGFDMEWPCKSDSNISGKTSM